MAFCRETLKYDTFCRENLDSGLWANRNGIFVLQADSAFHPHPAGVHPHPFQTSTKISCIFFSWFVFKVHPFICSCDLIWRHLFSINVVSMRYCQKSTCSISFEESNKNNIHTMERALPLCCLCHVCAPGISYMPRAQHHSAYLCPLLPSWLTGITSICSGGYEMCPIAEETWRMACHEL